MNTLESKMPFRRFTLVVTNLIKIAGLGIALHEAFWLPQPRALEMALAAFMMAGAQVSEDVVLRLAARLFGPEAGDGDHHHQR